MAALENSIDLSSYGITNVAEVVYNPSYELLFAEETRSDLTGFDKGVVTELGAVSENGKVRGCYLHGLFNSDGYRAMLLSRFGVEAGGYSYRQSVETALDELAEAMEKHLDVDGLLKIARTIRF